MKRYFRLFLVNIRYALSISMAYRGDFLMWLSVDVGWTVLQLFFFTALYTHVKLLGGWEYSNLLILLGWFRILNSLFWGLLWSSLWNVPRLVNSGDLDLYLSKPVNTQFMLSSKGFSLSMIPSLLVGVLLLTYGLQQSTIQVGILEIIFATLLGLSGLLICYAIWFMTITISFYVGRLENIIHVFPEVFSLAQFPRTAFPIIIQQILTFIIPVGLIASVPAKILLHDIQYWEIVSLVVGMGLLMYAATWFWNFALKVYSSASS